MISDFKNWDDVLTRQESALVGGSIVPVRKDETGKEEVAFNTPQGILKGRYTTPQEWQVLQQLRAERGYVGTSLDTIVPGIQRIRGEIAAITLPPIDIDTGVLQTGNRLLIGRPVQGTNRLLNTRDVTSVFAKFNAGLPEEVRIPWHMRESIPQLEGVDGNPERR